MLTQFPHDMSDNFGVLAFPSNTLDNNLICQSRQPSSQLPAAGNPKLLVKLFLQHPTHAIISAVKVCGEARQPYA